MNFLQKIEKYESLKAEIKELENENKTLQKLSKIFSLKDGSRFLIQRHEFGRDYSGAVVSGQMHKVDSELPKALCEGVFEEIRKVLEANEQEIARLKQEIEKLEES